MASDGRLRVHLTVGSGGRGQATSETTPADLWRGTLGSGPSSSSSPCPLPAESALTGAGKDAAELASYTWHANRHTWASRFTMAGVDPRTIMALGGSSNLGMLAHSQATSRSAISKRPGDPRHPRGSSLEVSALIGQNARLRRHGSAEGPAQVRVCAGI